MPRWFSDNNAARLASAVIVWVGSFAACAGEGPVRCEVFLAEAAASDRMAIGEAADYPADGALRGRADELRVSVRKRREAAWRTVEKVLDPVALAVDLPAFPEGFALPRWQTWYGVDDITRVFQDLVGRQTVELREALAAFSPEELHAALLRNVRYAESLPDWSPQAWQDYLAAIEDETDARGLGGIAATRMSPGAARHSIASYADILSCFDQGAPPPVGSVASGSGSRQVENLVLDLSACGQQQFGPYFIAPGEELRVTTALGGLDIEIYDRTGSLLCGTSDEVHQHSASCEASDQGRVVDVVISAWDAPVAGTLEIDYVAPEVDWAACLAGPFTLDSAIVKAAWKRADFDFDVPVYDTSPSAMATMLTEPEPAWQPSNSVVPNDGEIYTVRLANGHRYHLVGLHIMTKELDHWQWTSLWWSPSPDSDFGADRPQAIRDVPGPWANYKMCTTTAFREQDSAVASAYPQHPRLADALAASARVGEPSWCSNPYLEDGPGNAATNCIGCHQHAGGGISAETALEFPDHGTTALRNNFPHDYAFSIESGDRIGARFREVVDYFANE